MTVRALAKEARKAMISAHAANGTYIPAVIELLDALERERVTAEEVRDAALEEAARLTESWYATPKEKRDADELAKMIRAKKAAALNRAKTEPQS